MELRLDAVRDLSAPSMRESLRFRANSMCGQTKFCAVPRIWNGDVDSRRGGDVAGCPGGAILISQLGQHGVFGLREIVNRVEPEEFQESIGRPVFVQFGRVVFFHAQ